MPSSPSADRLDATRRGLLKGSAVSVLGTSFLSGKATEAEAGAAAPVGLVDVSLTINGVERSFAIDPRTTLVDLLREKAGLTGTKIGCNHGQCGACTALVEGRRVNTCLTLAASVDRAEVVTIEGLADPTGDLHPMQRAFIEHDAFQCGYCTPGQIVSAVACLDEGHAGSAREIREYMSGNLCRCGAYPNIVRAIEAVRDGEIG